jgi:DNA-binding transcriptional LysR family regulator
MEMFELRYFLAVAQTENVNRAAEDIHVSTGSLSKAISRLEEELKTPLFFKSGRGIKLTPEGLILKKKAAHILHLEEDARLELTGTDAGGLNVYLSSEEILQSSYGVEVLKKIESLFPQARTRFLIRTGEKAIEQVADSEVHLALVTMDPPPGLASKIIAKVEFMTCASKKHPLVKKYGGRPIPIEEVLKYPFVSPDSMILGRIAKSATVDGWRDDKFPRQIKYRVCGLKLMENLIQEGMALGYLPSYFVEDSGLVPLNVEGCPYSCSQTIRIISKDPSNLGWLNRVWNLL